MIVLNRQLQSHIDDVCAETDDKYEGNHLKEHREKGIDHELVDEDPMSETDESSAFVSDGSTSRPTGDNKQAPNSGRSLSFISEHMHQPCFGIVHLILACLLGFGIGIMSMSSNLPQIVLPSTALERLERFPLTSAAICILFCISLCEMNLDWKRGSHDCMEENKNSYYPDKIVENSQVEKVADFRRRIQVALGSVHAPSLSTNIELDGKEISVSGHECSSEDVQNQLEKEEILSKLTVFAEQHAALLNEIDYTTKLVRTVSGLRLGIGPLSPVVERVENSIFGCLRTKKNAATKNQSISAQRIRKISFLSMKKQNDCLRQVMDFIEERYSTESHDDMDLFETIGEEEVCTLTILKTCNRENGALLSKILSAFFNSIHLFVAEGHETLLRCLEMSITVAREEAIYFRSCFDIDRDSHSDGANAVNNTKVTYMTELKNHFHASHAMLLSFMRTLALRSKTDGSCVVPCSNEEDTELELLLKDLSLSLQNTWFACSGLQTTFFPKDTDPNKETVDEPANLGVNAPSGSVTEYDDEGEVKVAVNGGMRKPTKTLVFSGRGSKLPQVRKSDSSSNRVALDDIPSSFQISTGRMVLLRELQQRLKNIELPQELETTAATDDNDDNNGTNYVPDLHRRNEKCEKSMKFFTGVTGNMLLELKTAMAANGSEDHLICSSDDGEN